MRYSRVNRGQWNNINWIVVLAWRRAHATHTPLHAQINFGKPKIAHADRFYLPHITRIKQDVVFIKGKHFILCCFFLFFTIGHRLVVKATAIFLHPLLTYFFLIIDSKELNFICINFQLGFVYFF